MRFAELALFLAPLGAYVLWRRTMARDGEPPTRRTLALITVSLLLFGAVLAWFGTHERLPPGQYIPAALHDGVIVPGHAE